MLDKYTIKVVAIYDLKQIGGMIKTGTVTK